MKSSILVVAVLCACVLLSAEASISGKWMSVKKSPVPVQMEFAVTGATLTGTVRVSDSPAFTILDGRVQGDRLTFKTMITEGEDRYPLMFSGRRSGNRINFKCEVETNPPGAKTELGPACLQSITVARVK